jgi:hypothetical protein
MCQAKTVFSFQEPECRWQWKCNWTSVLLKHCLLIVLTEWWDSKFSKRWEVRLSNFQLQMCSHAGNYQKLGATCCLCMLCRYDKNWNVNQFLQELGREWVVENNSQSEPETWSRIQSTAWAITNKMKGTLQKQCKGHPLGGTTFLVHAVNQLMTRPMCVACNDRNICWNVLLVTVG